MCSKSTTSNVGKIGILLSLILTFFFISDFFISDASAQCSCKNTRTSVRKKSVRVRRTARVYRPVRVYRAPTVVYVPQPVYVPVERTYASYKNGNGVSKNGNGAYKINSVVVNGNGEIVYDADYRETGRIARDYGYRDGWEDGEDAGMERDAYHPENSGDYKKAANGYEDTFGSKSVYRQAYRAAYLKGYKAGFRSVASRSTYRAVTNW